MKEGVYMITYQEIQKNKQINAYLKKGDQNLGVLGFTDHSNAHTGLVAIRASEILKSLDYSSKEQELVKIAGYMHDIGNAINRVHHAEFGALLANELLKEVDIDLEDSVTIVSAIAHHDESTGGATDVISAALIIADKTDVRRNRVREKERTAFDIHDRVNYAVTNNHLEIDGQTRTITLKLEIDESICTMFEYFDIFLNRMLMSRKAAEFLNASFSLVVNGNRVL